MLRNGAHLDDYDANGDWVELQSDDGTRYSFHWPDGQLRTRCGLMPSMLTLDERVIRQDCLCYIMERYDLHLRDA